MNKENRELLEADAKLRKEKNDQMAESQQQGRKTRRIEPGDPDFELPKQNHGLVGIAESQQQGEAIGGHDRGSEHRAEAETKAEDRPVANG